MNVLDFILKMKQSRQAIQAILRTVYEWITAVLNFLLNIIKRTKQRIQAFFRLVADLPKRIIAIFRALVNLPRRVVAVRSRLFNSILVLYKKYIEKLVKYKIDESTAKYIINTSYVIILGIIFKSALHISLNQDASGKDLFQMQLTLSSETAFFFFLLVFYFLFDWFSTNVISEAISKSAEVPQREPHTAGSASEGWINHIFLLVLVIFIILLGFVVMSAINKMPKKFLYFGMYGTIVPFWDYFIGIRKYLIFKKAQFPIYYALFVHTRAMLALFVLIVTLFQLIRGGQLQGQLYSTVITFCIIYVAFKLFRYFFLVNLVTAKGR